MEVERLKAKDFDEAMDFINMVFSMAYGPTDFPKFLPRLYRPTDECMSWNLVVREAGRIRALVGLYPDKVQAGGVTLNLGGIGAVSSHPGDRGRGWMKLLMDRQIETMREEGIDLSFLTGLRQRYMYFGYEKTGAMLEYKLNTGNLKHYKAWGGESPIRFERMQPDDMNSIGKAKALYDAQPVRCVRPSQEFYRYLLTGYMQPWAALNADGEMIGYLCASAGFNRINELFALDDAALDGMIRGWFAQQNIKKATVTQPTWAESPARLLGGMAEDAVMTSSGNWRIFNWQKVVDALLRVKAARQRLADGTLCIEIEEYGNLKITVTGDEATCETTTDRADVEWSPFTAARVLFGNIPAGGVTAVPRSLGPIIASWFPLPLGWLPQNTV